MRAETQCFHSHSRVRDSVHRQSLFRKAKCCWLRDKSKTEEQFNHGANTKCVFVQMEAVKSWYDCKVINVTEISTVASRCAVNQRVCSGKRINKKPSQVQWSVRYDQSPIQIERSHGEAISLIGVLAQVSQWRQRGKGSVSRIPRNISFLMKNNVKSQRAMLLERAVIRLAWFDKVTALEGCALTVTARETPPKLIRNVPIEQWQNAVSAILRKVPLCRSPLTPADVRWK